MRTVYSDMDHGETVEEGRRSDFSRKMDMNKTHNRLRSNLMLGLND